jgi:TRAP-type C4-dicarboxylate transport system permease small subunit
MQTATIFMERLARSFAVLGSALLLALSLAISVNILLRWLFSAPVHAVGDLATLVTAVAIAAATPLCFLRQGNITVTLLGDATSRLSPVIGRVLDLFGALVTVGLMSAMAWQLLRHALQTSSSGATTLVLRWPTAPFWWVVALCFVFAAIASALAFLRGRSVPDD